MLHILAVDDEPAALDELVYLLEKDPRVGTVESADDGGAALQALARAAAGERPVDAVFLDIRMPGLDGLDVARLLARFADPVPFVFVSAHDDFAVPAFEVRAADYLLKPVRPERLAEAVRRIAEHRGNEERGVEQAGTDRPVAGLPPAPAPGPDEDARISVELANVTRFVHRSEVRHVEACGDYVRLHLGSGSHLLRVPLSVLEDRWRDAGFVRVHRRHLVAVAYIDELLADGGRLSVRVDGTLLPVSRRSSRRLRDLLTAAHGRSVAGPRDGGGADG